MIPQNRDIELESALRSGDIVRVKEIFSQATKRIKNPKDLIRLATHAIQTLCECEEKGAYPIAEYILREFEVDLSAREKISGFNNTPLLSVIAAKKEALASLFIKYGNDKAINGKDEQPNSLNSPLILAVKSGNQELALQLLARGADVNATDATGSTALHYACMLRMNTVIKKLLERKAPMSANEYKATPGEYYLYDFTKFDVAVVSGFDLVAEGRLIRGDELRFFKEFPKGEKVLYKAYSSAKTSLNDLSEIIHHVDPERLLSQRPKKDVGLFPEEKLSKQFFDRVQRAHVATLEMMIDNIEKHAMNDNDICSRNLRNEYDTRFAQYFSENEEKFPSYNKETLAKEVRQQVRHELIEYFSLHSDELFIPDRKALEMKQLRL